MVDVELSSDEDEELISDDIELVSVDVELASIEEELVSVDVELASVEEELDSVDVELSSEEDELVLLLIRPSQLSNSSSKPNNVYISSSPVDSDCDCSSESVYSNKKLSTLSKGLLSSSVSIEDGLSLTSSTKPSKSSRKTSTSSSASISSLETYSQQSIALSSQ
jgi:hypothetical protein